MKKRLLLSAFLTISVLALAACGKKQGAPAVTEKAAEPATETAQPGEPSGDTDPAVSEGPAADAKDAPAAKSETSADEQGPLPAYHYEGNEPYIESVSQFTIENLGSYYEAADVTIPAITILDKDETDPKDVKLWGCFWIYNYDKNGQILETRNGGENSGLIHLDSESNLVTDIDLVGDGSDYDKDAKRIFGAREGLLDKFYSSETERRRNEDRRLQIKAYVEANGLDITGYKDYGWESVMLDGSTGEAIPEGMSDASLSDYFKEGGTIRMEAKNDAYTEPGKSYTLDGLYDILSSSIKNVWGNTNPKEIKSISCAPVDRGGQVTTQFILKIEAEGDDGSDPLTIYYDVNKLGTEFVAVNMTENYYRSFATVNKYGICNNGGSGGAAIYYNGYDMVDPDGTPVRIYMCESDFALKAARISSYNLPQDYALPSDYPEDDYDESGMTRYVYSFEPEVDYDMDNMGYTDGYDDYLRHLVYVFEKDGKNLFPDDKYMKIYDEIGIRIVDQAQIDKMISDRLSDLGLTEDMLKQPEDDPSTEPEWTVLK